MVRLTIDGRTIETEPSKMVIEAAADHGMEIPHFCYHPKLSIVGNCRMCLVEIEKFPKLAIACSTRVADGMVVHTQNERVVKARNAVMEFLLINHPLDCPICDEAGECKLQDYAYKYSIGYSRFDEDKVHKPKRVELGPRVLLDVERCIMCSRCVRFADEIAKQPVLTFTERGTHVVLTTFPGTQLDNRYSMNVIEICPVGALTSRDFRFRSRVWEMSSTETVCVGCSRGCNTHAWVRNNEILRLTPRQNEEVNSYWMCDDGRLTTFKQVNSPERVTAPLLRRENELVEVGWDEAIAKASSDLRLFKKHEIAVLGSAFATTEDNYALSRFATEILGTSLVDTLQHTVEGDQDDLLLRADKTPNTRGAREVGVMGKDDGLTRIKEGIRNGTIKALYALEDDLADDADLKSLLPNLDLLIVHATHMNETTRHADIVLAASTYAEKHGTFVNFEGHVQRIRPSVATLEADRALDGLSMSRWDHFAAHNDRWGKGNRRDSRPSWRILTLLAIAMGAKWKYERSDQVFADLSSKLPPFKGLNYLTIGSRGRRLATADTRTPAGAQVTS